MVTQKSVRNLCYLICLRHLIRSRAVTTKKFSLKRPIFLNACATCSELPSNISKMFIPGRYILSKINQLQYFYHANIHKSVIHAMGTLFDGSGIKKNICIIERTFIGHFIRNLLFACIVGFQIRVILPGFC